jgi:hypothetical protein
LGGRVCGRLAMFWTADRRQSTTSPPYRPGTPRTPAGGEVHRLVAGDDAVVSEVRVTDGEQ